MHGKSNHLRNQQHSIFNWSLDILCVQTRSKNRKCIQPLPNTRRNSLCLETAAIACIWWKPFLGDSSFGCWQANWFYETKYTVHERLMCDISWQHIEKIIVQTWRRHQFVPELINIHTKPRWWLNTIHQLCIGKLEHVSNQAIDVIKKNCIPGRSCLNVKNNKIKVQATWRHEMLDIPYCIFT